MYEVEVVPGEWYACKVAIEQTNGKLRYELWDGTQGTAEPGRWRKR